MPETGLEVNLETGLPESIPVGRSTAVFVQGTCFHRERRVASLTLAVGSVATPVSALRMPRMDLFRSLHPMLSESQEAVIERDPASVEDPNVNSFRSGFWVTVMIPAADPGRVPLRIVARLEGGGEVAADLGSIEVTPATQPYPLPEAYGPVGRTTIAICMATFEPEIRLFRNQIESIRGQSDRDWICLVSDDCSTPDRHREMLAVIGDDPRFVVSRSERRLGFYRNFERALGMVPAGSELIVLADQDDRWFEEKLYTLRSGIGSAKLIYSDQRIVSEDGEVLADTYWSKRRNNHTSLTSLLIANTVTGAASMFTREVLDRALPFPETPGEQFHDQWLALVARSLGRITYLDRPLYDYIQHRGATLGHEAANRDRRAAAPWRSRAILSPRAWKEFVRGWRAAYFYGYRRIGLLAATLSARCDRELSWREHRMLRRIGRAERSLPAFAWLAARPLRRIFGRTETMGNERILAEGILWRHLIELWSRRSENPYGTSYDASLPPEPSRRVTLVGEEGTADLQRMTVPFEISVSESEPERINLLIPDDRSSTSFRWLHRQVQPGPQAGRVRPPSSAGGG
ncbi:MAG: glycosyltransferase [Solirubrobacterales bacterium]|nr:glycosyltransferase [Solirubrobacterales bacterium]